MFFLTQKYVICERVNSQATPTHVNNSYCTVYTFDMADEERAYVLFHLVQEGAFHY
jgi:hypothetical protein